MSQSHPIATLNVGYETNCTNAVISPNAGKQLKLFDIKMLNRSGTTGDLAFIKKLAPTAVSVYSTVSGVLSNISSALQSGTSTQIFTTTNNDGIVIQARKEFHMVGLTISVAQTASPTIIVQYWNGAAFVAVPNVIVTPVYTSTGYVFLLFNCPRDWVSGTGGLAGLDSTQYTLKIIATSSTVGNANAIQVGVVQDYASGIINNGAFERSFSTSYPLYLDANEAIIPYFGNASSSNMVTIAYSQED